MQENEIKKRAGIAVIMIWAVMALDIIMLVSDGFEANLLQQIADGAGVNEAEAEANDTRQATIGLIYTVVFIGSVVTFLRWFSAAYKGLHSRVQGLRFTEGWAVGAWFVPFLNLFRPYQIMKELYVETDKMLQDHEEYQREPLNVSSVGLWWGLWVVVGIVSQASMRIALRSEEADMLVMSSYLSILSGIISVPLALVAVKVIKGYARAENLLGPVESAGDELPDNNEPASQ